MAVKERVGLVVSDKMEKTVVVAVENRAPHPKYRKIVVRTKRYKVHDEGNKCKVGDRVRIQETRPLSRTKRWIVVDILGHTILEKPSKVQDAPTVEQPQPETQPESVSSELVLEQTELEDPLEPDDEELEPDDEELEQDDEEEEEEQEP